MPVPVIGAALVVSEGGLPPQLGQGIWLGRRRVQGHLLPQSLAQHAGLPEAAGLRLGRIMRIAVHPQRWRRGLGRRLLSAITQWGQAQGLDGIGASFGADRELLGFWTGAEFRVLRLGLSRDAASGQHAAMVLRPLSPMGAQQAAAMAARFQEQLPDWLAEPLGELDPDLVPTLLAGSPAPRLGADDWRDLQAFAQGRRGYELTTLALKRLLLTHLSTGGNPGALAIRRVLQQRPWSQVCAEQGLAGRRAAEADLRQVAAELIRCPTQD